jgi:hypothetical protein
VNDQAGIAVATGWGQHFNPGDALPP